MIQLRFLKKPVICPKEIIKKWVQICMCKYFFVLFIRMKNQGEKNPSKNRLSLDWNAIIAIFIQHDIKNHVV